MTALFGSGLLGSLTPQSSLTASETPTAQASPTSTVTETMLPPTFTATATSTQTPIPTATLPPPAAPTRPGSVVLPVFVSQSPVIDGNWDDFTTPEYSASYVTFGSGYWTGANDLSSSFKIEWDNNYLYIAARVLDDAYVQNSTGNYLYLGDSLEVLLDTDLYGDFYYNQLSPDDYQLGISPGLYGIGGAKEAYLWYPRSIQGRISQVITAATGMPGGYMVEVAIPWGIFNIVPIEGEHYGFAFSVSDNDSTGASSQQSMASNVSTRHLTQPITWGELVLIK